MTASDPSSTTTTAAVPLTAESRPALAPHVTLREDKARNRWVLLAPERMLVPDEITLDILRRLDGTATVADHAAALAEAYGAPEAEVRDDVLTLLRTLVERGFVVP